LLKWLIIALLLLIALNIADIAITVEGLSRGATELNPIYHMQGFQTFLLTKLSLPLIAFPVYTVAYLYLRRKFPNCVKILWTVLAFLIGFYSFIVANNLIVLWKLGNGI